MAHKLFKKDLRLSSHDVAVLFFVFSAIVDTYNKNKKRLPIDVYILMAHCGFEGLGDSFKIDLHREGENDGK